MSKTHHETGIGREAQIRLVGQDRNGDHKGTVFTATRILKGHGVSINGLRTTTFDGRMTGEPMFSADADVVLPANLDAAELARTLERMASDIAVDIELSARAAA